MTLRRFILRLMALLPCRRRADEQPSADEQLMQPAPQGRLNPRISILLRQPHCYTSRCEALTTYTDRLLKQGYELQMLVLQSKHGGCEACPFFQGTAHGRNLKAPQRPPVGLR
jgi:hypothetical protein